MNNQNENDDQPIHNTQNQFQFQYNQYQYQPLYLPIHFYTTNYNLSPIFYSSTTNSTNSVQNTSLYDKPSFKKIISENALQTIIPFPYHNLTEQDKQHNTCCCISQELFREEDEIIQLQCKHVFHKEPILHWLQHEKAICPICRYEYESVEIKNDTTNQDDDDEIPPLVEDNSPPLQEYFSLLEYLEQIYYDNLNQSQQQQQQQPGI
jgi:hypothetical protein